MKRWNVTFQTFGNLEAGNKNGYVTFTHVDAYTVSGAKVMAERRIRSNAIYNGWQSERCEKGIFVKADGIGCQTYTFLGAVEVNKKWWRVRYKVWDCEREEYETETYDYTYVEGDTAEEAREYCDDAIIEAVIYNDYYANKVEEGVYVTREENAGVCIYEFLSAEEMV